MSADLMMGCRCTLSLYQRQTANAAVTRRGRCGFDDAAARRYESRESGEGQSPAYLRAIRAFLLRIVRRHGPLGRADDSVRAAEAAGTEFRSDPRVRRTRSSPRRPDNLCKLLLRYSVFRTDNSSIRRMQGCGNCVRRAERSGGGDSESRGSDATTVVIQDGGRTPASKKLHLEPGPAGCARSQETGSNRHRLDAGR